MRRTFTYNPDTCQYEPVILTKKAVLKQFIILLTASFTIASGVFVWYIINFAPIQEQYLQQKNYKLKLKWETLSNELDQSNSKLNEFIMQDDKNFRMILDLPALGESERKAGVGGVEPEYLNEVKEFPLIEETYRKVEKLNHQVDVEYQSYEELTKETDSKIKMWASRPAIQPINNKQLNHLHTTYGLRLHPIFNVFSEHKGLDFSAPRGTPVYATGNGKVSMAYSSDSYGNVVYVDHGFNFETRYAHLTKYIVHQGQVVKRGQLIGYVGNTGVSAAPHLHYEVLFKGVHTNPINFFQRDLSNAEYEKLLKNSAGEKASLD